MARAMSPREFAARAAAGPRPVLLDVREDWELAIARLEGAVHIPMGEIPSRFRELETDREIVVFCRSGGRSAQVAQFLLRQGYPRVWNLAGGILAWSEQVDPTLPTY
jgi:rhodanese-related sulfurtransferase